MTDEYEYDAYGNSFTKQGTTPNNYMYRGEQYDADLGLYYLRARYYNPATGRFLSRDPENGIITDPASLHKYLYAGGDPINLIDPRGRASMLETGDLSAIIGRAPVPALVELAGGAYASAVSYATSAALWVAETAVSTWARVAAWQEAIGLIAMAKGLTRVFLCDAAAIAIRAVINYVAGSGTPFAIIQKFADTCVGYLNGLPFP
jgi:RHS repeat-associated protein